MSHVSRAAGGVGEDIVVEYGPHEGIAVNDLYPYGSWRPFERIRRSCRTTMKHQMLRPRQ
jgi:hypothetical protein